MNKANIFRTIPILASVLIFTVLLVSRASANLEAVAIDKADKFNKESIVEVTHTASTSSEVGYWYLVASPTSNNLEDISITPGSNGLDGWAVGESDTFIRWDGSHWNTTVGAIGDFLAVEMVSTNDGWATNHIEYNEGKIYHWNGSNWSETTGLIAFQESLAVVPGSNGQDVWSAGWWGRIHRWNGINWSQTQSIDYMMLYGVDALTASDAWAVGEMHDASQAGVLLHWDGSSWAQILAPDILDRFQAVEMAASNNVWAVGRNGVINLWNGSDWIDVSSPTIANLYGLSMVPGSNGTKGWAVGENGAMLYLDGSTWTETDSPTSNALRGIEMVSATDGWAVGDGGVILRHSPAAELVSNYATGQVGSYFTFSGNNYIPTSTVTVTINGNYIGQVPTDGDGNFSFVLNTTQAEDGLYNITASVNPSASTSIWIDPSEPYRSKEGEYTEFVVPNGIVFDKIIYLAGVVNSWTSPCGSIPFLVSPLDESHVISTTLFAFDGGYRGGGYDWLEIDFSSNPNFTTGTAYYFQPAGKYWWQPIGNYVSDGLWYWRASLWCNGPGWPPPPDGYVHGPFSEVWSFTVDH